MGDAREVERGKNLASFRYERSCSQTNLNREAIYLLKFDLNEE
jgi:hypothetical protein